MKNTDEIACGIVAPSEWIDAVSSERAELR